MKTSKKPLPDWQQPFFSYRMRSASSTGLSPLIKSKDLFFTLILLSFPQVQRLRPLLKSQCFDHLEYALQLRSFLSFPHAARHLDGQWYRKAQTVLGVHLLFFCLIINFHTSLPFSLVWIIGIIGTQHHKMLNIFFFAVSTRRFAPS